MNTTQYLMPLGIAQVLYSETNACNRSRLIHFWSYGRVVQGKHMSSPAKKCDLINACKNILAGKKLKMHPGSIFEDDSDCPPQHLKATLKASYTLNTSVLSRFEGYKTDWSHKIKQKRRPKKKRKWGKREIESLALSSRLSLTHTCTHNLHFFKLAHLWRGCGMGGKWVGCLSLLGRVVWETTLSP